jgi:hypothetical protein
VSNKLAWTAHPRHFFSFEKLPIMWPEQECEDRRDRVFGILGLVSAWDHRSGPISADYTKMIHQFYCDVLEQVKPYYRTASDEVRIGFTNSLRGILGFDNMNAEEEEESGLATRRFHYESY